MYLLINTSTAICEITLQKNGVIVVSEKWEAGRSLARDLLSHLENILSSVGSTFKDIEGIGVFEGPGSFTGLRIGMTVMNTIADAQKIQIVGARGDNWQDEVLDKLKSGKNEKIVLPYYGKGANITVARK
jgi:tRNA threonylcarbamoyladenosine biosynthesis protein TsaB